MSLFIRFPYYPHLQRLCSFDSIPQSRLTLIADNSTEEVNDTVLELSA